MMITVMLGTLLNNRYRLDAELGQGGMGMVYRGFDVFLERAVAVKVLSQGGLGTEGRARLLHEARSAAQLNHPNIVSVFDAGQTGESAFVVMELIEGESLYVHRPESIAEILEIARQVCAALEHAHAHDIVHRDLKPENVLVTPTGQAKLTDFGLARSLASRLTTEGSISGTVFYLAPELALGQPFDGRADLYALGVMLYELVARRLPFKADNPLAVVSQHVHAPVVPPSTYRPGLPVGLEALILQLMAKDPAERCPSARAALDALERIELGLPVEPAEGDEADVRRLLDKLARGRLIGRQVELAELHRLWKQALDGQATLALISGEPGVGKTRLANELVIYARLSAAVVLRGGCYEYEAATPYLPFVEALREWVRQQPAESLNRIESLTTELAKLAPEIESRMGPLIPNPPLTPGEERLRLFDHIARFIALLSAPGGLLLLIDDIHWADAGTLALLHYLLRHLRSERLMVVACYREVELDRQHPFAASLVEWNRERLANRQTLGRLGREEVRSMLQSLFGQETISDEFTDAIYAETEGNPYFIEEVVKSLIEQGGIYRETGRWQRRELEDLAIPQSIKEAIGRRLDRQSPECIEMLHTAAALGKRFAFPELAAVSEAGEDQLLDGLDEAVRAQLIRPETGEGFIFTHDKIREVLYEELNPIRRRRLHQRIGEGLEALYGSGGRRPIGSGGGVCCGLDLVQTLAHHFVEGGDLNRGRSYAIQAAERAEAVFAHDEALQYYRRALECAEALDDLESQAHLYHAMGAVHANGGSFNLAVNALSAGIELAADPDLSVRIKIELGMAYAHMGDERGQAYLEEARSQLDPVSQPLELARVHALLGRFHHLHTEWEEAILHLERARELAEPLDNPVVLTEIYTFLSGVYQWTGDFKTSMDWARKDIALAERTGYQFALALGYEFLAEGSFATESWKEALAYAEEDRKIGIRIGAMSRVAWAENAFAHAYHGLGDLDLALKAADETIRIVERTGEERLKALAVSKRAEVLADLGQFDAASADVQLARRMAEASGHHQMLIWAYRADVHLYLIQERWEELRELITNAPEDIHQLSLGLEVMVCIHLGRHADVRRLAAVLERSGFGESQNHLPSDWLLLAEIRAYQGDRDAAERCYHNAVMGNEERGARLRTAVVLLRRAHFYWSGSQLAAALADAERSEALARACGAAPHRLAAEAFLNTLHAQDLSSPET